MDISPMLTSPVRNFVDFRSASARQPLEDAYRDDPAQAVVTLRACGASWLNARRSDASSAGTVDECLMSDPVRNDHPPDHHPQPGRHDPAVQPP
jgi:hypothetical protein